MSAQQFLFELIHIPPNKILIALEWFILALLHYRNYCLTLSYTRKYVWQKCTSYFQKLLEKTRV